MAKVNYGVAGIRQRHYRVWIAFENARSDELDFVNAVDILDDMFTHIYASPVDYESAKRKLVEKVRSHANISLNRTTPLSKKKFNLFFISLK